MDSIRLKARAKINLGLDVVRKREDGYHEVRMVMQMLKLHDIVTIRKDARQGIHIQTNLAFLPTDERNIAYKAARLMMDSYDIDSGVNINIEKHIPVAAGMAGGSTDCAAVLYGMSRIFDLHLSNQRLRELGVKLGADVPYCLMRQTALSEGIGEILSPVTAMPDCPILVAKPPINVSTKYVYEHLRLSDETVHPDIDGIVSALDRKDIGGVVKRLGNVLETVTIPAYPVIADIKAAMVSEGALGALMSGSGPTIFGVFDDEEKARRAYAVLRDSGLVRNLYLTRPYNRSDQRMKQR